MHNNDDGREMRYFPVVGSQKGVFITSNGWMRRGRLSAREEENLRESGVINIEMALRNGDVTYEIIAETKKRLDDRIVMDPHRYTPIEKHFMGVSQTR